MSWEESHRKEQIFRKTKTNREAILRTVEDEDGKITLVLSLRNDDSVTELPLTIEEWKAILSFFNKTSEQILEDLGKEGEKPIAAPIAEPIMAPIAALAAEASVIKKIPPKIPVSEETFDELTAEIEKIIPVTVTDVPVVPSEQVIIELRQPITGTAEVEDAIPVDSTVEMEEKVPEDTTTEVEKIIPEDGTTEMEEETTVDSNLQMAAEILDEQSQVEDSDALTESESVSVAETAGTETLEPPMETIAESNSPSIPSESTDELSETILAPPQIPKVPEPSKDELQTLLTPIEKPKITAHSEIDQDETTLEPTPSQEEPIEEKIKIPPPPSPPIITSTADVSEMPEISDITDLNNISEVVLPLGPDGAPLSEDEKEEKILAAMEEVAALMPPGPAKRFVEEMMLKRAEDTNNEKPRIPERNTQN